MPADIPSWEKLADALLQREALRCRVAEARPPSDVAGLFVSDRDAVRILRTLPGLEGPNIDPAVRPVLAAADAALDVARAAFHDNVQQPDPFGDLVRNTGLDAAAAEALALVAAVEISPARQRLMCYLQDSIQLPRPTTALLLRMAGSQPGVGLVCPDGALLRAKLLVPTDETAPWGTRTWGAPPRLLWHLLGAAAADPGLPANTRLLEGQPGTPDPHLLIVHGADRVTRLDLVRHRWPQPLVVCPPPDQQTGWDALVREATIAGAVIVLETNHSLEPSAQSKIESAAHLAWALSTPQQIPLETLPERSWTEVEARDGTATLKDWQTALGVPPMDHLLDREQLRLVARAAADAPLQLEDAVRRLAGGHLDHLAVRVEPRRGWDDVVLPRDDKQQLAELVARHRHKRTVYGDWGFVNQPSSGTVALFAGPSGTGKTLAAEVVAGELGLDLYKIDLSAVVSKYIGETEKNLSAIFDAAAAGDVVLFFDEADALFGKRSEVSDAHDRYANIEVAYLLQRLETYSGLVVLATNLPRNLDTAFLRRIAVLIDFVTPDEAQRRAIWQRSIPVSAPAEDLDLDFLAVRFKITGGIIRNAALQAGFLAAEARTSITMEQVILALKREFQKLGRLRTETEFDRYFDLVSRDNDAALAG